MFNWLAEVYEFCTRISGKEYLELAEQGATEAELSAVEAQLGVALPLSYRNFLSRWNGAKYRASTILSTSELLEMADFAGFKTFSGDISEKIHDDIYAYYMHKPAYHLAFRTFELGCDVYCFDTRLEAGKEYPVCRYDLDFDLDYHLKPCFPSFEAMMLLSVCRMLDEDAFDMIDGSELSDDIMAEFEEEVDEWVDKLTNLLTQRGAESINSVHPDWSRW